MGLGKKTIDDQNYCGKKVLVRCDFNPYVFAESKLELKALSP